MDRLKAEGDLFKGVLGKGIDLEKVIKKAKSVFGWLRCQLPYILNS